MFVFSNNYIYFSHYCTDGRARVSTGIKYPKGLNGSIDPKILKVSEQLTLERVKAAAIKYVESCERSQEDILKNDLEEVVLSSLGKMKHPKNGLLTDFKKMTEDMEKGILRKPRSNSKYSKSAILNYKSGLSYLEKFCKEKKRTVSYAIDEKFVEAFIDYLTEEGYAKNSIAAIITMLKGFLSHMYRQKKYKSLFFKHEIFNLSREESDNVYLSVDEIHKLYSLKLKPVQERIRDVFVFACWMGFRSADIKMVKNYKMNGNFFEIITNKTTERVIIPVHPMAKEIYDKYAGNLPVPQNSTLLNYHITKICKLADLKDECLVAITKGGELKKDFYKKWEMISIHTARRSFATNAYLAGIKPGDIMKMTGHRTEKSFLKYIKIGLQENAAGLAKHPFFTGSHAEGN